MVDPVRDERELLLPETSLSHSSVIVSASLLLTALLGAGQALVVVFVIGEGHRTDAFLAAYSLYFVFAIFGGSLRASVVPLLGHIESERLFRQRVTELLSRILLVGLLALLILAVVSPLAGQLLTLGLPAHDRWIAVLTLIVLAPAAFMQIYASAQSAALSAARRFSFSSALYVGAGAVALGSSALLLELIGILGGAFGLLIGALVLSGGHTLYLRQFGLRPRLRLESLRERVQRELTFSLVAGAGLGIALQLNLAIALAVISNDPGAITAYSYAYFLSSMILTISSLPLGLVTLPDLVTRIAREGTNAVEDHFLRVTPYALAVLTPLLFAYAADGRPLLEAIFADSLTDGTIDLLYDLGLVLGAMAIPTALLFLGGIVTLALGRSRAYLTVGLTGIAIQAPIVIAVSFLGPRAVAGGHAATSLAITALMLATAFGRRWPHVASESLRRSAPALAFSTVFILFRLPLGADPSVISACASALVAFLAYAALSVRFWPSISTAFVDLLRRPSRQT
jgi:O-antigen/teichoic acid export membrane protein